jgi:hypothetical protein
VRQTADQRPDGPAARAPSNRWLLAIALAALIAFAGKITIALTTYGTNDVSYWAWFLERLHESGGVGLYHSTDPSNGTKFFNHPPFMIRALQVMNWLTVTTGVPFPFWLRLPAIIADLGSLLLVWRLLAPRLGRALSPLALLLLALAPPSIMIAGFHGNTDPVMIAFVLLALYLLDRRYPPWLAGIAFGMSLNIKIVPVIFVVAIVLHLPDLRRRLGFLIATGATFLLGSLPFLLQDPVFIVKQVFGYGSFSGFWGVSRLLTHYLPPESWAIEAYANQGKYVALAAVGSASLWLHLRHRATPLFQQCGLLAFIFLALSPGFGVQYLAWLIPWVVVLGVPATALFYATSGLFLFLVYTYWSQAFPWYLADSVSVGLWQGPVIGFELLCWATILALIVVQIRQISTDTIK